MPLQSSPSSFDKFDFDVFLSFRGFDTRVGFTGNLYNALCDRGIRTFIDDRELQGGEEITPSLLKAIEDSRIVIIIFSKNYADSSFCLDELVHIILCFKTKDRLILPIFYGVEATHLRHQTGSYGEAIAKHEAKFQNNKEKFSDNMERLQKWKMALNQAANLSGHTFSPVGKEYEYEFIGKIVDFVSNKINRTPLHVADYRVGLESRVLQVKSLLNLESDAGVCMVGIHGIGGIGKTTLAREIYNSIANQFKELCFIDDVRQKTHRHGLVHLQETLLYETVKENGIKLGSVNKGISILKLRLQTKKVLLILDDVDDLKQLQVLAGGHDWFGRGSRVIVTTRDKHVLASHGIEITYEVKELNKAEAFELLRWKAFRNNKVDSSYKDILHRVVTYASGLPLALEVMGSNLCGKNKEKWESSLARYKRNPHKDIQTILQVSFDALEKDEKSVFLDIACCFNGYKLANVEHVLCAHHGHCIKDHIEVLVEKSLLKIDMWGCVRLHDLIEDMGKEIVQQESPKELGERSRLWFHEDIVSVLEENTGTSKIEIIYLDCRSTDVVADWNGKAFKEMGNLKTVIIESASNCHSHFPEGLEHFPSSLRVLIWEKYPLQFLPSILLNKNFRNMTVLVFECSESLTDTLDMSGLPNLEIFSFAYCTDLITIHDSVGFLSKLKILNVGNCFKLRNFPPIIKLPSLHVLRLTDCKSLESFPEIAGEIKNITKLDLKLPLIKELPSSFQNFTELCELTIQGHGLRLPISILTMLKLSKFTAESCRLLPIQNDNIGSIASSNVKVLHLRYCTLSDEILSMVLKLVVNVEELSLEGNYFAILPECIKDCCFLSKVDISGCPFLQEIRGIPPNLKYLYVGLCKLLISSSCRNMFLNQELHEDGGTNFCFRDETERIPEWFEHQSWETSISFWFRKSIPFVALFCHSRSVRNRFSLSYASLSINGYEDPLCPQKSGFDFSYQIHRDHTYLFDMRLQDRGLESNLREALLKNEWIHVEVAFMMLGQGMESTELSIGSGIHVLKQKTNMDDIRFIDPYEGKRK